MSTPTVREGTITLCKGDKRFEIDLQRQYTAQEIGRMFRIVPSELWLREKYGSRVFFPSQNGLFQLDTVEEFTHLEVEGGEVNVSPSGTSSASVSSTPTQGTGSKRYPGFSPVLATHSTKKTSTTFNLKVIRGQIDEFLPSGRPTFLKLGQIFIELCESTANVPYVSEKVKNEFGNDHVLVSADGLEITDSSGTQGMKFWKTSSRKVYAVPVEDLKQQPRRKREREEGDETQVVIDDLEAAIQSMRQDLTTIKDQIKKLCAVTKDTPIPTGLKIALVEALQCKICYVAPMHRPIYAKCCKQLLGCEPCVNTCFSENGANKPCPNCGTERGLAETSRICGLDDLLDGLKGALGSP